MCDIQELNIGQNMNVTDKGIRSIVVLCRRLARLGIAGCNSLTPSSIYALARYIVVPPLPSSRMYMKLTQTLFHQMEQQQSAGIGLQEAA